MIVYKKLLLKLHKFIEKLLFGNLIAEMPLNIVRSIIEVSENETIKKHILGYNLFNESLIEYYNFPKEFPLYFRRTKAFDPRYIYKLNDVIVSPFSGLCWIKEGKIFAESIGSIQRIMGWGGSLAEIRKPIKIDEKKYIISFPDTGYFHWLLEILPIFIHIITKEPDIKILISPNSKKYVKDVLEIIFKERYKEIIIQEKHPAIINNFILPSIQPYSGFVTKKEIQILRNYFLPYIKNNKNSSKKIYISRSKTKKRNLYNELELEEKLKVLGFEIVHMELLPFLNQIEIMQSANLIIAPHGAGLANLAFANNASKVLEIFPYNFYNDCFARLAMNVGVDYHYIRCENDSESFGKIPINSVIRLAKEL